MSSRYRFPTSLRYLKARLWFIKRPMFWGASAVLLLATVFIAEYWTQPNWFQVRDKTASSLDGPSEQAANQDSSATLPPAEDNSIGADIDSLPLLFNEIQGFENDASDSPAPETDELAGLFSDSSLRGSGDAESGSDSQSAFGSADSYIRLFQPFNSADILQGDSGSNLLPSTAPPPEPAAVSNFGTVPNSVGGGSGLNTSSSGAPSSGVPSSGVLGNPLQSALDRSSGGGGTLSAPNYRTPIAPNMSPQNQPSSTLAAPSSPSTQPNSGVNPPYYQTAPSPGTTGYTVPQVLRTVPNTSAGSGPSPVSPPDSSGSVPSSGLPNGGYSAPAYTPPPPISPQS